MPSPRKAHQLVLAQHPKEELPRRASRPVGFLAITQARLPQALVTREVVLRAEVPALDDTCVVVPSSGFRHFVAAAPVGLQCLYGWGRSAAPPPRSPSAPARDPDH